jgi:hypothetical protein
MHIVAYRNDHASTFVAGDAFGVLMHGYAEVLPLIMEQ